jgi:hypothetical protein
MATGTMLSLNEALKAQKALREAAGLGPERFPLEAFVGMISDEIETLRERGKSDTDIAEIIRESSSIEITPEQISEHYASPDARRGH